MEPGDKYTIGIYLQKDYYAEELRRIDKDATEIKEDLWKIIDEVSIPDVKKCIDEKIIPGLAMMSKALPRITEEQEFHIKRAVKDIVSNGTVIFSSIALSSAAIEEVLDNITDIQ